MIKVGIAEVDITPEPGLPMEGMLRPPKAIGVQWPLMGRILVFDDGVHCAAVVCLDLLSLLPATVAELRQAMAAGTELAPTDVLITCSHTHRGPFVHMGMDEDPNFAYLDLLRERLTAGMVQALAARRLARITAGQVDAPGWTFNRRPVYKTDMGEQVGTQGPLWIKDFLRMEGPADSQMQALLFHDTDGKVMGGLVNYSCHPTVMGMLPYYSADYCGAATEVLAQRHGGIFAFMQGAAGNLWCVDRGIDRPLVERGRDHAVRMGAGLADKFDEAIASGVDLQHGEVRTARTILPIAQRRPTREQVELAKWYLERAKPDVNEDDFTRRLYGHPYAFFGNGAAVSDWFARETIGMWEWQRRVGTRELVDQVEVQVVAVGEIAFAGFPAEYFTEFGLKAKGASPFLRTFVAELANGYHGYVPTQEAFAHGGYEPRFAYSSRLVPDAGDRMCDAAIEMLQELGAH